MKTLRVLVGIVVGFGLACASMYLILHFALGTNNTAALLIAMGAGLIGGVYSAVAFHRGIYQIGVLSILGYVLDMTWSVLNTAGSLLVWLPTCMVSGGSLVQDDFSRRSGTFVFSENPVGIAGNMTVGTVIGGGWSPGAEIHVWQARMFGPFYMPVYLISFALNFLLRLFTWHAKDIVNQSWYSICFEDWAHSATSGDGYKWPAWFLWLFFSAINVAGFVLILTLNTFAIAGSAIGLAVYSLIRLFVGAKNFDQATSGSDAEGLVVYRGFIVWAVGIVLVLGIFLGFVAGGWPGPINRCANYIPPRTPAKPTIGSKLRGPAPRPSPTPAPTPDCYCEAFDMSKAVSGAPGVRQPVNTWFNLYSILTSLCVATFVYLDRRKGLEDGKGAPIRSSQNWYAEGYIFAVQFLGLGSMFFHGSIKAWGGITDQASIFVFVGFLIFYTIRRLSAKCWNWLWWCSYVVFVVVVTAICAYGDQQGVKFMSLILTLILAIGVYGGLELWVLLKNKDRPFAYGYLRLALWLLALGAIGSAAGFWAASGNGGRLCNPQSSFQPHGLLWHPLAGVMAVLIYFYWRLDDLSPSPPTTRSEEDDLPNKLAIGGLLFAGVAFLLVYLLFHLGLSLSNQTSLIVAGVAGLIGGASPTGGFFLWRYIRAH